MSSQEESRVPEPAATVTRLFYRARQGDQPVAIRVVYSTIYWNYQEKEAGHSQGKLLD